MGKDQPLRCGIEGDELVIRIGIDTLAFGCSHSPKFYEYEKHRDKPIGDPFLKITDNRLFATDVVRALQHEEEDGSGPLSDLLDEAAQRAIDDGAEGVDYEDGEQDTDGGAS